MPSWIKNLHLPLEEDKRNGWKPYHIFRGSTRCMDDLSCHVSVLSPGITPHEPHSHPEEELLIMLSGEVDLVITDPKRGHAETRNRIGPGAFVYYPAFQHHTIHNVSSEPATYLMFKWHGQEKARKGGQLKTTVFHYGEDITCIGSNSANKIFQRQILDNATGYLQKLHSHVTTLQLNAGYPPHSDAYDVAILLLTGTVETLGQRVASKAVIFYAAGEPHGMKNIGSTPASYLVFEFHKSLHVCFFSHSSELFGGERSLL